jgi:hypothetical protein
MSQHLLLLALLVGDVGCDRVCAAAVANTKKGNWDIYHVTYVVTRLNRQ